MKKTYAIEVDCANCAAKIEAAIQAIDGITAANVNFMTQKMTLEFAEGADAAALLRTILKTARNIEPDFSIL